MNDATLANTFEHRPQTRLDGVTPTRPADFRHAYLHVKEDRIPYDPDTPSAGNFDSDAIPDAESQLDEALNLVGLMLAAVENESDSRAMQVETGLRAIERRIRTARIRIDEHDTCHARLLSAYRDLKEAAERGSG